VFAPSFRVPAAGARPGVPAGGIIAPGFPRMHDERQAIVEAVFGDISQCARDASHQGGGVNRPCSRAHGAMTGAIACLTRLYTRTCGYGTDVFTQLPQATGRGSARRMGKEHREELCSAAYRKRIQNFPGGRVCWLCSP